MCEEEETRTPTSQLTLPPQSSASTNSATSAKYLLTLGEEHTTVPSLSPLVVPINRAENGTRTRDPNLGKVVLYQLSYFRNFPLYQRSTSLNAVAKVLLFSKPANFLEVFFRKNAIFLVLGVFLGDF